jgi:hypothetical protein
VSLAITIAVVWIAASILVAAGWMLTAWYVRHRQRADRRAVREWRDLLRALAHPRLPHLPRQRGRDDPDRRDQSA